MVLHHILYNVGFNDDLYYIVMEYIDGITLKKYIEQEGKLNWQETLHFSIQVLKVQHLVLKQLMTALFHLLSYLKY